ncbi:MAG: class I SAM-dependent methyltransferase [Phycisphaerae bacterium]|nr:class I SAM-dependent methyltransferase [Phycisphaerae bacterium]
MLDWDDIDWDALTRIRGEFLDGSAGHTDYWRSERDLASYDATFAQRIGWKWDFVLAELGRRGWSPPPGPLLDWGCGTGIAARRFLRQFGPSSVSELILFDRSALAMQFAARIAGEEFPQLKASLLSPPLGGRARERGQAKAEGEPPSPFVGPDAILPLRDGPSPLPSPQGEGEEKPGGTLLVSHVLTELRDTQLASLIAAAQNADAILWVEPGAFATSRSLIAVREQLRPAFRIVAPCTHENACPMLAPGNEPHWCHQVAPPPPEVFTDGNWVRFGRLAGIDLRSLPLSFLVLDRREPSVLPSGAARIIGRPRMFKAYAEAFTCDDTGLRSRRLQKRRLPEQFKQWKRGDYPSLAALACEGDDIVGLQC